jgi:hypothetical protein
MLEAVGLPRCDLIQPLAIEFHTSHCTDQCQLLFRIQYLFMMFRFVTLQTTPQARFNIDGVDARVNPLS